MKSGDRDHPGKHGETLSVPEMQRKISQVWWHAPVVPDTREAEAEELLEPNCLIMINIRHIIIK